MVANAVGRGGGRRAATCPPRQHQPQISASPGLCDLFLECLIVTVRTRPEVHPGRSRVAETMGWHRPSGVLASCARSAGLAGRLRLPAGPRRARLRDRERRAPAPRVHRRAFYQAGARTQWTLVVRDGPHRGGGAGRSAEDARRRPSPARTERPGARHVGARACAGSGLYSRENVLERLALRTLRRHHRHQPRRRPRGRLPRARRAEVPTLDQHPRGGPLIGARRRTRRGPVARSRDEAGLDKIRGDTLGTRRRCRPRSTGP